MGSTSFVYLLLPAYGAAVPAMRWAIVLPLVSSFYPMASVLQVVRRQDLYGAALVVSIGVYVGVQMWLIRSGVSLVAFPKAMLAGRAVFATLCAGSAAYLCFRERSRVAATT
jgi:hypothetical protein